MTRNEGPWAFSHDAADGGGRRLAPLLGTLGAIAGDVIGSVFERHNVKTAWGWELFDGEGRSRFTDDSILTVATADAILSGIPYAQSYRNWFRAYPNRGYGTGFGLWAADEERQANQSMGNGAAMRVSPVGWAFDDLDVSARRDVLVFRVFWGIAESRPHSSGTDGDGMTVDLRSSCEGSGDGAEPYDDDRSNRGRGKERGRWRTRAPRLSGSLQARRRGAGTRTGQVPRSFEALREGLKTEGRDIFAFHALPRVECPRFQIFRYTSRRCAIRTTRTSSTSSRML